ncbi:hypothetical protein CEXT_267451 [Caerostris extrusa]|uniref:Uncharacterized protein n=1 Tax=Caerostris extrusa TaxID=172846 RepID=A0AAV4QMJ0_CAEEX|nr:hypothetical protein CEXT_267451 [Caerostris extrusa]
MPFRIVLNASFLRHLLEDKHPFILQCTKNDKWRDKQVHFAYEMLTGPEMGVFSPFYAYPIFLNILSVHLLDENHFPRNCCHCIWARVNAKTIPLFLAIYSEGGKLSSGFSFQFLE